jgi:uncharacterized membrane protein YfcA
VPLSDTLFLIAAALAVTCLGLSKSGFAGFGLAATPVLALAVPPLQAAAILLPLMILQDVISIWAYRREWSGWNLAVLLPSAALGIGIAWWLAAYTSDALVRLSVGLIAVACILSQWRKAATATPTVPRGLFWGGLAGFAGTLAHAAGPPFQMFVLPQKLDKLALVGTAAIFFAVLNALKVVPYVALGQFSTENLATSLALAPLAIATNFFGIWLVRRVPTSLFYRIAYGLVFLVSLELIRSGVFALWRG